MKRESSVKESERRNQAKIVLLILSGEAGRARRALRERYPEASFEEIPRSRIEGGRMAERLRALRALRPDIFAVATERLTWQRGQNAFLLFGALAGARRVIILDAHGGWREEARGRILLRAPARLAREAAISAAAMTRAARHLRRLELAVKRGEHLRHHPRQKSVGADTLEIVYVRATPGPGTQAGGAASHINGFINAALSAGTRISLVSNDQIAGLDEKKTPLKIIWPKPIGSTRAAFDLYNNLLFTHGAINEIKRQPPDFIYQRYSRFSWAGVAASLKTRRPLFLEYNGSEVWVGRYWDRVGMLGLLERYERLNLRAAARIFVVSEVERENLLRAGVADEKIVVNPNGVDAERFRPNIGGELVRRALGVEENETLVGFVGTFGPWHGVVELAQAITMIPKGARVRFLLVGTGVLREKVEETLREGGAAQRVILTGAVEHERVASLLDACDVLASPHVPLEDGSPFFGSPTKLFEYMAMGKGIVASRLGQIGDVLSHEETALLVEPGNVRELCEAIMRLANERGLRERLGAAARLEAVEKHTWSHNARRVLEAYLSWSNNK
ncbi:MAG TPA: glycosyltransferase family 4 protein [Pyrinomonadaceae bacterium]